MIGIVGLGNPESYAETWHNLGKEFCKYLLKRSDINCVQFKRIKDIATIYRCQLLTSPPETNANQATEHFLIAIPDNIFMNNSASHLIPILKQLPINILIVAHDDFSFKINTSKLTPKPNKSHNGVKGFINNSYFKTLYLRLGADHTEFLRHNNKPLPLKKAVLQKIDENIKPIILKNFQESFEKLLKPIIIKPDLAVQGYLQTS